MNHVVSITDAEGGVTSYGYDARNLLISESFPGVAGGIRQYRYDAGDRLASRLDQSGVLTTYLYDGANRLTTRQYPDARNDHFTYDPSGRLLSAVTDRYQNTVTRSYDPAGRLMAESLSVPGSPGLGTAVRYDVHHGYDIANRDVLTSYPDATQVLRTYTARNQLASISYAGTSVATRVYDLDGRLLTTSYGNGLVESRAYRADNTVSALGIPTVTSFSYQYDHVKRKLTETDGVLTTQSQTFTYDAEGRITGFTQGAAVTTSWTLSPVGDWTNTLVNGVAQTEGHNQVHEMTSVGSQSLSYDPKGNLTTDASGNACSWDVENRLAAASGPGTTAGYTYDALGRRVSKVVNGLTTTFVSAGNQEVWEVDTNQSVYSATGANGGPGTPALPAGGILSGTKVIRVDFQTAAAAVPTGYSPDSGGSFAPQASGQSYGWAQGGQPYLHEYTSMPLPQYNGNDEMQSAGQPDGVWQIALANGTYPVVVVLGDAGRRDMTNTITVGGVVCTDPNPDAANEPQGYEAGRFVGYAVTASVTNGSLTLTTAPGAVHARACFIEIGAAGGSIDAATQQRLASLVHAMTEATAGTPPKIATRAHVFGSYIDEPLLYVDNATPYYVHSNDLYSVAALIDSTGAVVERYSYDAYGRQTVEGADGTVRLASSYAEPWGFTGRRNDPETGLMFYRARMYSPELGRFVGRDATNILENYDDFQYHFIDGYDNGQDLYASYFCPDHVDPEGTKWKFDGNNIWEALSDEDDLQGLSTQLIGSSRDWVGIWPVSWADSQRYPKARCGEKADVSNLTALTWPSIDAKMLHSMIVSGTWVHSGDELAQLIKSTSNEGRTPISYMRTVGHGGIKSEPKAWEAPGGDVSFSTQKLYDAASLHTDTNDYLHASQKIGPPRTWFTRIGEAVFAGCGASIFAQHFAKEIMRGGAEARGNFGSLDFKKFGWLGLEQFDGTWNHYVTDNANFYNDPSWEVYPGHD